MEQLAQIYAAMSSRAAIRTICKRAEAWIVCNAAAICHIGVLRNGLSVGTAERFKGAQTQPCVGRGDGSSRPLTLVAKADFYTSREDRLVGSEMGLSRRNW
jgi:hypothetical protein